MPLVVKREAGAKKALLRPLEASQCDEAPALSLRDKSQVQRSSADEVKVKHTGLAKPAIGSDSSRECGYSQGESHVCGSVQVDRVIERILLMKVVS